MNALSSVSPLRRSTRTIFDDRPSLFQENHPRNEISETKLEKVIRASYTTTKNLNTCYEIMEL